MIEVQASKAARSLGKLINRVLTGEDVLITRAGEPVAMLSRQLDRPRVEVHVQRCPICLGNVEILLFGKPGATFSDHLETEGDIGGPLCPSSFMGWPLDPFVLAQVAVSRALPSSPMKPVGEPPDLWCVEELGMLVTDPCPYCSVSHRHGAGGGGGHRSAHCSSKLATGIKAKGYTLRIRAKDGEAPRETVAQKERDRDAIIDAAFAEDPEQWVPDRDAS